MQIEKIELDLLTSMAGIPQDKIITEKLNEIIEVVNEQNKWLDKYIKENYYKPPTCPPSGIISVEDIGNNLC